MGAFVLRLLLLLLLLCHCCLRLGRPKLALKVLCSMFWGFALYVCFALLFSADLVVSYFLRGTSAVVSLGLVEGVDIGSSKAGIGRCGELKSSLRV